MFTNTRRFSFGNKKKEEGNSELKDLVLVVKTNKGNVEDSLSRLIELAGNIGEEQKQVAVFTAFKKNDGLSSLKEKALKGEKGSTIKAKAFELLRKLTWIDTQLQMINELISIDVSYKQLKVKVFLKGNFYSTSK